MKWRTPFFPRGPSYTELINDKSPEKDIEERGAINLTDAVSAQMGMFESTDGVVYRDNVGALSLYRGPGSITRLDPEPIPTQVLRFNDGTPVTMGIGSADGVPTVLGTI